ncbi:hypothetical protein [Thalassobaculum salexigens]|uniref:hypothetical protein n=1 Tax=Thalassobaculum salexigens TaxID=455360 RepID=UPI000A029C87|nr:hypothetical protein [Thalassobaculum salexigens]
MPNKLMPDDVLQDPATSLWLREALSGALLRDPVDAVNDGEVLVAVLTERANDFIATASAGVRTEK